MVISAMRGTPGVNTSKGPFQSQPFCDSTCDSVTSKEQPPLVAELLSLTSSALICSQSSLKTWCCMTDETASIFLVKAVAFFYFFFIADSYSLFCSLLVLCTLGLNSNIQCVTVEVSLQVMTRIHPTIKGTIAKCILNTLN